jgi:hypothetical protein
MLDSAFGAAYIMLQTSSLADREPGVCVMSVSAIDRRFLPSSFVSLALTVAAVTLARPVGATEALGDLDVQLRVVELTPDREHAGPSTAGVAKIEVLVQAFHETRDVQLRVLRADGSEWSVKGRPVAIGRPAWTGPGGEPLEPDANGPTVRARGAIRTTIVVPLAGAEVHEIFVAVTGRAGEDPVATSGAVRAALGGSHAPVDDGTYANFSVGEVK